MHRSTCSSTSSLVFMVSVLSLWAITPAVPLIPTFIAIASIAGCLSKILDARLLCYLWCLSFSGLVDNSEVVLLAAATGSSVDAHYHNCSSVGRMVSEDPHQGPPYSSGLKSTM
ncbi:hypothetical protein Tco_1517570 [Tanacetum coccineum]